MKNTALSAVFTICIILSCTVSAKEIKEFNNLNDFAASPRLTLENGSFCIKGAGRYMSESAITIDPNKTYTLSMKVRRAPSSPDIFVHIGFQQFSEDGTFLMPEFYRIEKHTATTLVTAVKAGDKTATIIPPKYWRKDAFRLGWHLAFDTKGDPNDVPNMNIYRILKIEENPAGLIITIQNPIKENYDAGATVCFQSMGPGMYTVLPGKEITTEWTEVSGKAQGVSIWPGNNQWWQDAVTAKILFILSASSADKSVVFEFKDIKLIIE